MIHIKDVAFFIMVFSFIQNCVQRTFCILQLMVVHFLG